MRTYTFLRSYDLYIRYQAPNLIHRRSMPAKQVQLLDLAPQLDLGPCMLVTRNLGTQIEVFLYMLVFFPTYLATTFSLLLLFKTSMMSSFVEVHRSLVDRHTCSCCPTLIPQASRKPISLGTPSSWAQFDQEQNWQPSHFCGARHCRPSLRHCRCAALLLQDAALSWSMQADLYQFCPSSQTTHTHSHPLSFFYLS